MIRVDLDEQAAVDLFGLVKRTRDELQSIPADSPVADDAARLDVRFRDLQLALSGGLRAAGWTPTATSWIKRVNRSRR